MAIVKMQKISIAAAKKHRKAILEQLQDMGLMELHEEQIEDVDLERMDTQAARNNFERAAQTLDMALKLLKEYAPEKNAGLSLFSEKKLIPRSDFQAHDSRASGLLTKAQKLVDLEKEIHELGAANLKDRATISGLTPWMSLDIPMSTRGTAKTEVFIGTFPEDQSDEALIAGLTADLPADAPLDVNILARENRMAYVCLIAAKSISETLTENMRQMGFARPAVSCRRIPGDKIKSLEESIERRKRKIEENKKEMASYGSLRQDFYISADYYRSRALKYELLGKIPQTRHIFFLQGWVTDQSAEPLARLLSEKYGALVQREERNQDELEPTVLENPRIARPVEPILASYGLPTHGRFDPTKIMTFFYVIFFGMMLSDAGYGILVSLGTGLILLRHRRLEEGLRRMLQLFFMCGLSTTFWGFMYGGFFGNAIDTVASTFFGHQGDAILKPLWFEPLKDPMRLLIWCMLFGLIHLYTGLAIKGYETLKAHDVVGFISDILSWFMMLTGLVLMLLPSDLYGSIAGTAYQFPAWLVAFSKILAGGGALIILVMSGRSKKNWALRIALGAYDIYGVTGWLSDLLSYSRLLALGLATGVIANVINLMASMVGGGPLGPILFAVVFILGHSLNIGINLLGAYVHTNRLQYVEFFSKFYDGGGRAFQPFGRQYKYIQIKEDK